MIMSLKIDYRQAFVGLFRAIVVSRAQEVILENLEKRYTQQYSKL